MSKVKEFSRDNDWERWNTHDSTMVEQEIFGTVLHLVQDPSSEHLGTTVWDASVVLAKFVEKNIRKGDLSRARVMKKRALELGAGMGLAGMAFAMVGADVVMSDTREVLGKLRINYERNLSPAAVRMAQAGHRGHGTWADFCGKISIHELDWTKADEHIPLLSPPPPYDFVLAADCVYHEFLTESFHTTIMKVTNERSTVVVCNEFRSKTVHERFMELFKATHTIKTVARNKMDDTFWHPSIHIYIMKKRRHNAAGAAVANEEDEEAQPHQQIASAETGPEPSSIPAASTSAETENVRNSPDSESKKTLGTTEKLFQTSAERDSKRVTVDRGASDFTKISVPAEEGELGGRTNGGSERVEEAGEGKEEEDGACRSGASTSLSVAGATVAEATASIAQCRVSST